MLLSNLEKEIVKIKLKKSTHTLSFFAMILRLWALQPNSLLWRHPLLDCNWIFRNLNQRVLIRTKETWCEWCLLITNSPFSRAWEKTVFFKKFHQWYIWCKVLSEGYYQRLLPGRCTGLGPPNPLLQVHIFSPSLSAFIYKAVKNS